MENDINALIGLDVHKESVAIAVAKRSRALIRRHDRARIRLRF